MTPKRRQPAPPKVNKKRPSKLAKENNLSAEEEAEIKEAFSLFVIDDEDFAEEEECIKTGDVRRCLIALNITTSQAELREIRDALDPESEGFVTYENFLAVAALKLKSRHEDDDDRQEEVQKAYSLFTRGGSGPITVTHLKKIARELKEDLPDQAFRDMIAEANGGAGAGKGVDISDFEDVMRRAGVFG